MLVKVDNVAKEDDLYYSKKVQKWTASVHLDAMITISRFRLMATSRV